MGTRKPRPMGPRIGGAADHCGIRDCRRSSVFPPGAPRGRVHRRDVIEEAAIFSSYVTNIALRPLNWIRTQSGDH